MDDASKRKPSRSRDKRLTHAEDAAPAKLLKGPGTRSTFDRSRDPLRQQQPPRDKVSIPGVHDGVNLLFEKIAVHGFDGGRQGHFVTHATILSVGQGTHARPGHSKPNEVSSSETDPPNRPASSRRHCFWSVAPHSDRHRNASESATFKCVLTARMIAPTIRREFKSERRYP